MLDCCVLGDKHCGRLVHLSGFMVLKYFDTRENRFRLDSTLIQTDHGIT